MQISFEQKDLADIMSNSRLLFKRYPGTRGKAIARRLDQLRAASCLEDLRNAPGRCEELRGNRQGQFSMRVDANYRIIFRPDHDPVPTKSDGGIDWTSITSIVIITLMEDYH